MACQICKVVGSEEPTTGEGVILSGTPGEGVILSGTPGDVKTDPKAGEGKDTSKTTAK